MARGRRLQMPVETQMQCILEGLTGRPVEELCRQYGLSQSHYYRLRDRFLEGGKAGLVTNGKNGERAQYEGRIAELERVVGRLTVENQALKKTLH